MGVLTLRRNSRGTASRHRVYQRLDSLSWDSYPCFMQQQPQSVQVTWFLILYSVPFGRGLPIDVLWGSSPVSVPPSPGPLHQSARGKHIPSTLNGKGNYLAGSQTPAPDHDKAVLLRGARGFWALWCTGPAAWYLRIGRVDHPRHAFPDHNRAPMCLSDGTMHWACLAVLVHWDTVLCYTPSLVEYRQQGKCSPLPPTPVLGCASRHWPASSTPLK